MQQNTTFQLDRISMDDKFSPDTLNGNAAQVEAALNTMSTMMVAGDAALRTDLEEVDARVTALEARKIVAGTYTGVGASNDYTRQTISLGFTPIALFVEGNGVVLTLDTLEGHNQYDVEIVEGGFTVRNGSTHYYNDQYTTYRFLAIG